MSVFIGEINVQETEPSFSRQENIVSNEDLNKFSVTLIGAGAIGSFTALSLTKMGLHYLEIYDSDKIEAHNLPNQFYRVSDIGKYKVEALEEIVKDFNGADITPFNEFFTEEKVLGEIVIVATDSMSSRRLVWEEFKKREECKYYIEARMGGEIGMVYTIQDKSEENIAFYEAELYSDEEASQERCGQKAIIYNVNMISSIICRAFKSIVKEEPFKREVIFGMGAMVYLERE